MNSRRVRVAELALEQHRAVVEQRDDRHRARVADVFARALLPSGRRTVSRRTLSSSPSKTELARDEMLGQVFHPST